MSEEIAILLGRAAGGDLDPAGETRLDALCAENPALRAEAEGLRRMAEGLSGLVDHAEAAAAASAPAAVPAAALAKLEAARKEVFQIPEVAERRRPTVVEDGLWKKFSDWLGEITALPTPALASAAALLVAVVGAGWWMSRDGGSLPLAVVVTKDVAFSAEVSILSPGDETSITDPTLLWLTVNPEAAVVSVLSADGERELFRSGEVLFKAEWSGLEKLGEIAALQPGESYLLRVAQGGSVSERVIEVTADAKPVAAWLADPVAARAQIETWLGAGAAGDALALATALAAAHPEIAAELAASRSRARDAAMAAWEKIRTDF